jgi:hypothetical protein
VLYQNHWLPTFETVVVNFPAMVVVHAMAIQLFGNTVSGFRLLEFLWQTVALFAIYKVSRLWLPSRASLLGCFFFAIYYVFGPDQFLGQPDCFAILPLVLGIGFSIKASREQAVRAQRLWAIGAGIFYAIAVWFRPTFSLVLVLPLPFLFDLRNRLGRIRAILALSAFALVIGSYVLLLASVPGGLQQEYLYFIRYNFEVYSHAYHLEAYSKRAWIAAGMVVFWSLSEILKKKRGKGEEFSMPLAERRFLFASYAAVALDVILMGRLAGYHFVPFCSLFMPVLAAILWEWKDVVNVKYQKWIFASMIALLTILLYPSGKLSKAIWSTRSEAFTEAWYEDPVDSMTVAYISRYTNASDSVEVAAFSPSLRWRIDHPHVTHFTTVVGLFTRKPDGRFTDYQQKWREEYVNRIASSRPKFYIAQNPLSNNHEASGLTLLLELPGLSNLLTQSYRLDTTIGRYWIYERR